MAKKHKPEEVVAKLQQAEGERLTAQARFTARWERAQGVVIIAAIAAALWYTPQGRNLLQKFGIASADVVTTTDIS